MVPVQPIGLQSCLRSLCCSADSLGNLCGVFGYLAVFEMP